MEMLEIYADRTGAMSVGRKVPVFDGKNGMGHRADCDCDQEEDK